jgi:ABC-type dipeptide/oligopeptide/nickel transport system permease component
MNTRRIKMVWMLMFLMILMYISSEPVTAYVVTNEVQVDEDTRELLEKKYGLDRPEEPKTQQHFFSGDWGMSFRTEPPDSFDRLVHVVPFSLRPLAWIFRLFV